jgi:hypothetical protein
LSASKRGKPGHPHTAEQTAKVVAFHLGRRRSPETCAKISAAKKLAFAKRKAELLASTLGSQ